MKTIWVGLAISVVLLLHSGSAGAYIETFDTDSAGWGNDTVSVASPHQLTMNDSLSSSMGGNPDGYVYGMVPEASTGTVFHAFDASMTPSEVAKFGNLTGTILTADFKSSGTDLVNAAGPTPFARFYIGSGTTYFISDDTFSWNPNGDMNWTTHQVTVDPANFLAWPQPPGSLTFAQVVASPTDIGIVFTGNAAGVLANQFAADGINGNNTIIALDNFGVDPPTSQSVPEPSALLLLASGLCGLGLIGKRRMAK